MNTCDRTILSMSLIVCLAVMPATAEVLSRAFEFRAVNSNPKANGETDFKGRTAVFNTEERVAFLNAYADYAAAWFGDPKLDTLAVPPAAAQAELARIKPLPLPSVRRSIRLNDGWKQTGRATQAFEHPAPWRTLPSAKLADGALHLPAGTATILELSQSAGWRFELSWRARLASAGTAAVWRFGTSPAATVALTEADGWHAFRLQADLLNQRAYVSRDGRRVGEFPLSIPAGDSAPMAFTATGAFDLDDLVFIDYRPTKDVEAPYTAVVLADDAFELQPDLHGWSTPDYRDDAWSETMLPAVRGGFREAGEDLYLRRRIKLPAARRAWLEVEALDPSGEIYLNGTLVATITNRRPVFVDVTPQVRAGANLLALKVNHFVLNNPMHHAPADRAIGWFAGRTTLHLLSGEVGLRDLRVHTATLGADGAARQSHTVVVDNAGDRPFTGTLAIAYRAWFPVEGKVLTTQRLSVTVAARSTREIVLPVELTRAEPWSPERPVLYAVSATLTDDAGTPVDDVVTTTGIRTVAQRDGKLLLNNQPAMLNGAQIMGFRPAPAVEHSAKFNRCAPALALLTEMLAVKRMGGNLLRVHAHAAKDTPDGINDPRIPEMADQLGLWLIACPPFWIREGDERHIDYDAIGPCIRQVYNHPSIVIWEVSNHPNTFKSDDSPERTHTFVRRSVTAVLAHDTSRLISPTTFWQHTHYANDLGTIDRKGRAITPVPEYTHPLVTRGTQDAITGYGAEWSRLREWPTGLAADTLRNRIRAWFNFEHEESAAQPNWNLSAGWPWHRLRSYEDAYEKGSIGRILNFEEWRASQAWQAFSAYESMRKQIWRGVSGFSWCTIEGGANSGTYGKPLLDPLGHAKLAWHLHKMVFQPVLAGSDNVDVVYGPQDKIVPCVFNLGRARAAVLTVTVRTPAGRILDEHRFPGLHLAGGRSLLKLPALQAKLPSDGYCVIEYTVTAAN